MQQIESFLFNVIQANYKMPKQFLRWWLLVVLTIIGAVVANYFNMIEFVWDNDFTKISFVIAAIFTLTSAVIGYKMLESSRASLGVNLLRCREEEGWGGNGAGCDHPCNNLGAGKAK